MIFKAQNNLYDFDRLLAGEWEVIVGIDEAGRGPLAGPVAAAAVALNINDPIDGLDDSKKLTPIRRKSLYHEITSRSMAWAMMLVDENEIERLNILRAALKAMHLAALKLDVENPFYLVDGNCYVHGLEPQMNIVKGDSISASIAAASIIAKVTRDEYMKDLSELYPEYGFEYHFGYATRKHVEALHKYGPCPHHRVGFEPVKSIINRNL